MAETPRDCPACGTKNEEDARFCDGCGGSLARICGTCGVEARAEARFCRGCGASLDVSDGAPPVAAAGPVRKTVTVMFADLAGSTSFEERVDAETAREVIGRYHELLRSTAQRHRAGVTKYIGDGFMAVWGVPETGLDDAGHAVEAGVELQDRFVELASRVAGAHGVELALRVAVNTGEVVIGEGDADIVGDALNVAARLEAECPRGHVVVGEETWRSTRGQHRYDALGQVQVKGRTTPVAVFQWVGHHAESADAAPFVGRADEVRRLQAALGDATRARAARMVTVIGDPGVGKTRLAAELVAANPELRVIRTRCNVEESVALAPIVELLRSRDLDADLPVTTPERDRMLRDLNGLAAGVPGSVEETFWALRRFVEALAADGPLLIVLDDLQWADTLLFDFVEHLVEWVSQVPVLVLALARPELREVRADLVAVSRWVTQAVHLDGLDAAATAELAAEVLGGARLPEELLGRLPSSTGGNPLFVRELIGMLVDDEVLVHEPAGWRLTIDVDAITIPPTIHALLASRLERLDAADRRVLEIASVLGTDFSLGAVAVLAERGAAAIKPSLDRLRRLQLAQPSGAYVGDEPVWRFHHVLIRDVAYRRLLKSDRADLHVRFADWVEAGGATLASDPDEMVARHLESAHGYRLDLGTLDDRAGDLALRSARCYLASARRALDRDELASAGSQAARGAALATADDAVRAELLLIGCEAFLSAGDVATCAPLVDDLEGVAGEMLAPWATCYRCQFIVYTDPERLLEVDARLQEAIDEFNSRNDAAGLAKAHRVRARARASLGRIGDCESDLLEALIAARRSGDQRQITAALSAAPSAALWGPSPVPKAGGRCLDVVRMQRMATAAPSLEATSLRHLAVLELLRGRPDKARSMLADARQVVADLGLRHGLMETELFAGIIESMVGDPVAAEPHFRTALDGLDALGVGADAGLAAALLARSVLAQGRADEADGYAAESQRLAGHNLKTAIAWRAVRAEILCAQGSFDEAAALAREGILVAAGTDLVLDHADACLALGRILTAAGDARGADGARRDAEALYAAKEVVSAISRPAEAVVTTAAASPPAMPTRTSRLSVTNRASEVWPAAVTAMRARDVDGVVAFFSDDFAYDDRRRLHGNPIGDLHLAFERIFNQYNHFDWRTLAVRGELLHLLWSRWSDDSGNETTHLHVHELGDDGRIVTEVRFDEDDFEGAYRELERRYYAGEGGAFAVHGHVLTEWLAAMDRLDVEAARSLAQSELRWLTVPSALSPADPTVDELFRWLQARRRQVSSVRHCISAIRWLSPKCCVALGDARAVGLDGEDFAWTRLYVVQYRDGLLASVRQFELDDEVAAFAYAEEKVWATTRKLALTNRASEVTSAVITALQARDVDGAMRFFSDDHIVDDRRPWLGNQIPDFRTGLERVLEQYRHLDWHTLAVRGQRLHLCLSHWSDDSGNESSYLHVFELGDDGRINYEGRFGEDDFEGAYRELEGRYYAGEGAAFAVGGALTADWMVGYSQGDFDRVFGELTNPDFRLESRSGTVFGDRSIAEVRASFEELAAMVSSARGWLSAICWLSPTYNVSYFERQAVGLDGEQYTWTRLMVAEYRDGRLTSMCDFDPEAEEQAFAYCEERVRAITTRLPRTNRASDVTSTAMTAMQARDVVAAMRCFADEHVYDDRRRLRGNPIGDFRTALERILEQYSGGEWRALAVRGERLNLAWSRWWDDAGNETAYLHVYELDEDARIGSEVRFDEDDFESAYRELERRYYVGEGAEFAAGGAVATEVMAAYSQGDFDGAFSLFAPDFLAENRSRNVFGDRSAAQMRASNEELSPLVASARGWLTAIRWLSPTWAVGYFEREAVGLDGEQYAWTRLVVAEIRGGLVTSMREFEPGDEEAAFAYAEEQIGATASRLAVTNRASETWDRVSGAMAAHDVDAVVAQCSDGFVYDDRRAWSGEPIDDAVAWRAGVERFLAQYYHHEASVMAVRGARLALAHTFSSDDAGNEAISHNVIELGEDGRIVYWARFDEDDFESAYRELDRRYAVGEGAAFADGVALHADVTAAMNRGDLDTVFNELIAPDFRAMNRSRSLFGDRTVAEYRANIEELSAMVASARTWYPAVYWLSPAIGVARIEREAVGLDGEKYAWTKIYVGEIHDRWIASICEFDLDDEDAAFAYAESLIATQPSRLAVTNRASEVTSGVGVAMSNHDVDAVIACCSSSWEYDDRRGLSGDPIKGLDVLRAAVERIFAQYSHFEGHTLAVRGERVALGRSRWSDDSGNETVHLHLIELGDDGLITREVRFDEDDFEGAYRELERRYAAGEGAEFAEGIACAADWLIAVNRGDFDRAFGELMAPDYRIESRSRSVLGNRSATELRISFEELKSMVAWSRSWNAAVCWLSPKCAVNRFKREAIGLDGQQFVWERIHVGEFHDGRCVAACEFDPDDEDEAFAYAEERVRATAGRLAVANRSSETWRRAMAMQPSDIDEIVESFSDQWVFDDRRRFSGSPLGGRAALRTALERILQQYSHFEARTLAVRGERLHLAWTCWSDESGNETSYLHVYELDDDGRIGTEVRFDDHDFESAYRELDRRYYAGEGAPFAAGGAMSTEYFMAMNRGDYDRVFGELTAPDFRGTSRSRSVFGDRSTAQYRASVEELDAMVSSARSWVSAVHWVSPTYGVLRFEREAVGLDGEEFAWTRLYVNEVRDGRVASMCEFELEDEGEAFAYAESLEAARPNRLAVTNPATERERRVCDLVGRPEFDSAALDFMHEQFRIVDRRAMSGTPFVGRETGLVNLRRFLADYPNLDIVPLAVRGERLALVEYRGRTPEGYEANYLNVNELDEAGRLVEQVRFDGDDFEGAYRELEERYYAGEGAPFAAGGALQTEFTIATNRGDLDKYGEVMAPDFRFMSRSRSIFGDRSAAEVRAAAEELAAMVASVRMWFSAVHWLSPTCNVGRMEREAVGLDGEKYAWTRLNVAEIHDGVVTSICEYEVDDEDAAFAYAESLVSARPSRLAVTNPGSESQRRWFQSVARDGLEAAPPPFINEQFQVIDRRAMPSAPCIGGEAGVAGLRRLLADYPEIDAVTLAVRGESLALIEWHCRNPSGFEATYLNVHEFDEAMQVVEQVRFDGDDFEGAYRELEERYYAGEGAAFAAGGAVWTDYVIASNRRDFDRVFGDLVAPDFRMTSRSRSAFGDRSAAEYRASQEELAAMVTSARGWVSALHWLSPTICVARTEREAVGLDREAYAWTRIFTSEVRDGRFASACEFELENEQEAFAYAEELLRIESPTASTDE